MRGDELAAIVKAYIGEDVMVQVAAFPYALEEVVNEYEARPGWSFVLWTGARARDDEPMSYGLTLEIRVRGQNAYHPEDGDHFGVRHLFIVPAATYDHANWRRWLVDRCLDVEQHEFCEWFRDSTGERPYAPNHGPGHDPYFLREVSTDEQRRTNNRGEVKNP